MHCSVRILFSYGSGSVAYNNCLCGTVTKKKSQDSDTYCLVLSASYNIDRIRIMVGRPVLIHKFVRKYSPPF
jgi:hypothetical protein